MKPNFKSNIGSTKGNITTKICPMFIEMFADMQVTDKLYVWLTYC